MNGKYDESFEEHKDMYVINLDLTRIFWIIAIGLFSVTFFFLFGYWLGNDTVDQKSNNISSFISRNQQEISHQNSFPQQENTEAELLSNPNNNSTNFTPDEARTELARIRENNSNRNLRNANASQNRENIDLNLANNEAETQRSHIDANKPYAIQVSIHRVKANAVKLRKKLLEKGFDAFIHTKQSSRGYELSFVRVGPFPSETEAQRTQYRLRRTVRAARDCLVIKQR